MISPEIIYNYEPATEIQDVAFLGHEIEVTGITLTERKEVITIKADDDENDIKTIKTQTRTIYNPKEGHPRMVKREYVLKETSVLRKPKTTNAVLSGLFSEIDAFHVDWRLMWNPNVTDEQPSNNSTPGIGLHDDEPQTYKWTNSACGTLG